MTLGESTTAPMKAQDEGFQVQDFLVLLERRKALVLSCLLVGLVGGAAWTFTSTPVYEATATLQVGPPPFASFLAGEGYQPGYLAWILSSQPFDSEIQVLKSRTMAEEVAKRLHPGDPTEGGQWRQRVEDLRGRISVGMIKGTTIMAVKVRNTVPEEAARETNTLSEAYIAFTARRRTTALSLADEFIGRQLEVVGQKLRTMQQSLRDYQGKHRTPKVASEAILQKVVAAEVEKGKAEASRKELEGLLDLVKQPRLGATHGLFVTPAANVNGLILGLVQRLGNLELQRATMRRMFTDRHPEMLAVEREITEVRGRLIQETEALANALLERERSASGAIGGLEGELKRVAGEDLGIIELMRAAKVSEEMYGYFLKKQEEARIAVASDVGDARLLDRALPPAAPILPNTSRNRLLGLTVGLALGVALAMVRERLDHSVRSVEDLEREVGLPVFGTIPAIAASAGDRGRRINRHPFPLLVRMEQHSPALEAYRSLRTTIQFALPEARAKSFLITSPGPAEGKSLTAANLAIALARKGGRTLLIDGDLRRPVLHGLFRASRESGLTDLLAGERDWRPCVRPTEVTNLELLPVGPIIPNPSEMLGSERMQQLLGEMVEHYDAIVIDSPPVLPFTDALVLGAMVDGVFLVARARVTRADSVLRARALLQAVNARVLGVILNAIRPQDDGYLYRYHQYYYADGNGARGRASRWLRRIAHRIGGWPRRR
jgi:tyrosine-protein kinase Etk/Wzc